MVFGRIEPHEFARLHGEADKPIGQDASERLHAALQAKGYLDAKGQVTDALRKALNPEEPGEVEVPEGFEAEADAVVALLRERAGRRLDVADADEKKTVRPQRTVIDSPTFAELWERVRARTVYRVDFDSRGLVEACVRVLQSMPMVERARVRWEVGRLKVARRGIAQVQDDAGQQQPPVDYVDEVGVPVPDAVGLLQERTGLTRATVAAVQTRSGRAGELRRNPQAVIKLVGDVIEEQKHAAIVDGLTYERTGAMWAQTLFDAAFERDLKRLMEGGEKSACDLVPVDSDVERAFLKELQAEATVKLFAKLPRAFRVPTPLGMYEPDWAVLVERGGADRLYLVVKTKGGLLASGLRGREMQKINCGKAHFTALAADRDNPGTYHVERSLDGVLASL